MFLISLVRVGLETVHHTRRGFKTIFIISSFLSFEIASKTSEQGSYRELLDRKGKKTYTVELGYYELSGTAIIYGRYNRETL